MPNLAQTPLSGDGSAFNLPTVRIRNKSTGEVRNIPLDQAPNFGISLEDAVARAAGQREAEADISTFKETGAFPSQKEPEAAAVGRLKGILSTGFDSLNEIDKLIDPDKEKKGLEGRGKLFQAIFGAGPIAGEKENLADVIGRLRSGAAINKDEEKRFKKLLPHAFKSAERNLRDLERLKGELEAVATSVGADIPALEQEVADSATRLKKKDEVAGITQIPEQPQEQPLIQEIAGKAAEIAPLTEPEGGIAKRIILGVGRAAPVAGAVAGGFTGALLGAGAGSLFTGALGTAIGTGAGIAFEESLQDLLGVQEETPQELLKKGVVTPATAAALDLAGGALFRGGAVVVKTIGKAILKIGDDIVLRAIRPSASQLRKFLEKTGQPLKDFVIEKGLFSKGVDLVDSIIKPLQSSFDDIASRSGIMVSVDDVITKFSSQIDELQKIATTEADSLAKKLIKEADLFINKWGGQAEIPVGELTNLRRTIDNLIPESTFLKDPITAGKNRIVRNIYQETIQAATQGLTDAAGRSLKEIGEELHKLYSFRGIAAQQAGLGVGTLPVGLIKIIAAGGGAAAGGIKGFLAGLGLSSLGNNPKIIAYLAKNLPIVGQAIQGLPEKQAARIITDVFRRLLTNIGAVEISKFGQEK